MAFLQFVVVWTGWHAQPRAQKATEEVAGKVKEAGGKVQQLLGIRGGAIETDKWKIRLQLTKPVTWVPLIWGEDSIYHQDHNADFCFD